MVTATKKTDNTYFNEKVNLRIIGLPNKKTIYVLDCFAGEGLIWKEIKKRTSKNIKITPIERELTKGKLVLRGDNLKYLGTIDLTKYDIIDLDAYGIPFSQIEILFDREYKGIVFVTANQSLYGCLPRKLLYKLGYTKRMIDKC